MNPDETTPINSYTVTSHQSFGSRLQNSISACCMGPVLVIIGILVLVWNEGDAVHTHRALDQGAKATISLPSPKKVDPQYEARLVHLTGRAETTDEIRDELFGTPTGNFLKLKRQVEMYQWTEQEHKETKKHTGGGETTTTTYSYSKDWQPYVVNSDGFYESHHHRNPNAMPFDQQVYVAHPITLGAHELPDTVVNRMDWYKDIRFSDFSIGSIVDNRGMMAQIYGNGVYIGQNPYHPEIGDTRVSFQVVEQQTMSLVAEQIGDTFTSYATKYKPVLLVEQGVLSAAEMFQRAHSQRTMVAFLVRLVGFIVIFIGLRSLAEPLATFADIIPCFGTLVGEAASCVICPFALAIALLVIGIAWIAYRPMVAIPAVVAIAGVMFFFIRQTNRTAKPVFEPSAGGEEPEIPVNASASLYPTYHQTGNGSIPVATVVSTIDPLPPPLNPNYQSAIDPEKGRL